MRHSVSMILIGLCVFSSVISAWSAEPPTQGSHGASNGRPYADALGGARAILMSEILKKQQDVDEAIENAQRAGVVVYSIYTTGSGHAGHSFFLNNWGQNYLSELSEMTGGESYWQGFGPAVSFSPYLDELAHQLQRQFLLTFVPQPQKKAGFQKVRLTTETPGVELIAPKSVFVPASVD